MALVGEIAPDFKLQNENGEWVQLSLLARSGPVLLAFYPGDFQPVCKRQLCSYQDSLDQFKAAGVQLVGVSSNTPQEHAKFKSKYGIEFPLLSDPKKAVTKSYRIASLFLLGGSSRAVFVLDRNQRVLYRYVEPTTLTHRKTPELIEALRSLASAGRLQ